jgi:hypothetical protein
MHTLFINIPVSLMDTFLNKKEDFHCKLWMFSELIFVVQMSNYNSGSRLVTDNLRYLRIVK